MTTHVSDSKSIDWLTKIHNEAFPTENSSLDVQDTAQQTKPFVIDDVAKALHQVVDMFVSEDLVYALQDMVNLFEADERCQEVGSDEWVWYQQAQMILDQYDEPSQLSESYAEKLQEAYTRHGGTEPLVLDVASFLGVEDSLYVPNTMLEDVYLPSHGDLTWFPPSPPAPPAPQKFQIKMADFEIETTMLVEPARELPTGWVSFNVTFDGEFNWSAGKEPEDTTPEGILFSKIED